MYNHDDRFCPIAQKEIGSEVCYEVVMCLTSGFSASSVPEIDFKNDGSTRALCDSCPHSDLD